MVGILSGNGFGQGPLSFFEYRPTERWRRALTEPVARQRILKWGLSLPGTDEYVQLGKEAHGMFVKNLYHVGTVGMSPWPVIIDAKVGNVPTSGTWGWEFRRFLPYAGDQWYFKE